MNTLHCGLPHSRPRVYILGMRVKSITHQIHWPPNVPIRHSLETMTAHLRHCGVRDYLPTLSKGQANALVHGLYKIAASGANPFRASGVVDINASKRFVVAKVDVSPCITAHRGRAGFL
eukprot:9470288-Pyramimonas_sp.AAC.1